MNRKKVMVTILVLSSCCITYSANNDRKIVNIEVKTLRRDMKEYRKVLKEQVMVEGRSEKIIENSIAVISALAKNDVFNIVSTIIDESGKILEKKMADMREEAETYLMLLQPEDYRLKQSLFNEIKKKTIMIQQLNNAQLDRKKLFIPFLLVTAVYPPLCFGLVVSYPLYSLVQSQRSAYERFTKKPQKNDNQTKEDVQEILNSLRNDADQSAMFEVFTPEEQERIHKIKLGEHDGQYNMYKDILTKFDFEQKLHLYYNTWFSRRTMCHLLFMLSSTSLTWLAAKKINAQITNRTYRDYDNAYTKFKIKMMTALVSGISWVIKIMDPIETPDFPKKP